MPEPSPAPTAEELVVVSEITLLTTDEVLEMVSADSQSIADAKWARTLEDIQNWDAIRRESGDVKKVGNIEFFENKNISTRLDFRNMIRTRYGKVILMYEGDTTQALTTTLNYF